MLPITLHSDNWNQLELFARSDVISRYRPEEWEQIMKDEETGDVCYSKVYRNLKAKVYQSYPR